MPSPENEEPVTLQDEAIGVEAPARKARPKHRDPEPSQYEYVDEVEAPVPATKSLQSTVGVAVPEVDVKKIVDDSAGATPYTVMLAIVAVVGGGAGWKFYQNYAKQKHEQAMKALEIEQSKADRQQSDHQACSTRSAALSAQVESLSSNLGSVASKVSQIESKLTSMPDSPPDIGISADDVGKIDKRVKILEKKLTALSKSGKPGGPAA